MVNFGKQFGGASGGAALEAKGAVVEAACLGRTAMNPQAVRKVAAGPTANTSKAPKAP